VASLAEAEAAAAKTGYPLVLKPRGLGASEGVVQVDDASGLADGYRDASSASHPGVPTYERGVLVEEYLDGPEISVDGYVCRGRYQAMFVAHKQVGLAPFFEETEHVVVAADPLLDDRELMDMLAAAHRALGVDGAITHTEVKFTSRGPRIVEVNAGWAATSFRTSAGWRRAWTRRPSRHASPPAPGRSRGPPGGSASGSGSATRRRTAG